jgi:tripartite-type tricarboxylate transporter receptor subunit TctC
MRQRFGLIALFICAAMTACLSPAQSESYPTRPVKIIVGFAAGGTVDALTRIYANKLSQYLGKQVIVENIPGAGGHIASAAAARAQSDGYTLFLATNANTTGVSLYEKLNYRFPDDFEPIAMLASAPSALVVSPMLDANSVKELIAAAKAKPGQILYGSAGVGTGTHMAAELFQMETQTKMTHVAYKELGAALLDLMGGRISVLFSPLGTVIGSINGGKLKGLAVTTERRTALAPDIPTIAESGVPGFDVKLWIGLVAPKGTPEEVLQAVGKAVAAVQQNSDLAPSLLAVGGEPVSISFADFADFMRKDIQTWAKVVEHTGIKIK